VELKTPTGPGGPPPSQGGRGTTQLPAQLVPVRDHLPRQLGEDEGVLFHSTTLSDLIRLAAGARCPLALDLDSIEGLEPSGAAITFAVERLGIHVLLSRRPALMAWARQAGCLPLLWISCLDSTGFERALTAHPGPPVGTAISPGLVLAHLPVAQRSRLPHPLLAHGLVRRQQDVAAARAAGADSVVIDPIDIEKKRAYKPA
jgi:glycerol-3-phosphate responsive antiterminator